MVFFISPLEVSRDDPGSSVLCPCLMACCGKTTAKMVVNPAIIGVLASAFKFDGVLLSYR